MIDLDPFKKYFDHCYPRYGEKRYNNICLLVKMLPPSEDIESCLESQQGRTLIAVVKSLVEIVNYKSQKPFPTDLPALIREIVRLKRASVNDNRLGHDFEGVFNALLKMEGLQLPTVSAIFHFCYPSQYPIVDRWIAASCELLVERYGQVLGSFPCQAPRLPAPNASEENKLKKYKDFISLLDRIRQVQESQYQTAYCYRELDKALMVFGKDKCREQVEQGGHA
jgi:hypothetical protein